MSRIFDDVVVTPINKEMVQARFAELRAEHPNGLTNMEDHFGLALLMVNYEWRIDNSDELAELELNEFIQLMLNSNFFSVERQFKNLILNGMVSIGVHHQKLEKHFLVQLEGQRCRVMYNKSPLDAAAEDFVVEVTIYDKEVPQEVHAYTLCAKGDEEAPGNLIDLAWLGEFEGDNLVLEIPGENVRTVRRRKF